MRKLNWIDYTDVDTQQCLLAINEKLAELGISEEDVISSQRVWNEDPVKIYPPRGQEDKGYVTMFVFYWGDN